MSSLRQAVIRRSRRPCSLERPGRIPSNPSYVAGEAAAKRGDGDLAGARVAVDNGLTRFPEDKTLLTEAVATAKAQNDTAAADAFQARLDALPAG